jgi:Domain of unknown function (DUF4485)
VTANKIWKENRNFYAKNLLSMLARKKIEEPFTRFPSEGPLQRLTKYDVPLMSGNKKLQPQPIKCLIKMQGCNSQAVLGGFHKNTGQGLLKRSQDESLNEIPHEISSPE